MKYVFRFMAFLIFIIWNYILQPFGIICMLILYSVWTLKLYDFKKDPFSFNFNEYHQVIISTSEDYRYYKIYYKNVWDFLLKQNLIKK